MNVNVALDQLDEWIENCLDTGNKTTLQPAIVLMYLELVYLPLDHLALLAIFRVSQTVQTGRLGFTCLMWWLWPRFSVFSWSMEELTFCGGLWHEKKRFAHWQSAMSWDYCEWSHCVLYIITGIRSLKVIVRGLELQLSHSHLTV